MDSIATQLRIQELTKGRRQIKQDELPELRVLASSIYAKAVIDDIIAPLIERVAVLNGELEIQKGISKIHERTYERCGVINRALRDALRLSSKLFAQDGLENPDAEFLDEEKVKAIAKDALKFTPTKADKVVEAMLAHIKALENYADAKDEKARMMVRPESVYTKLNLDAAKKGE